MGRKTFLRLLLAGSMIPFVNTKRVKEEKPAPIKYYELEYMGNKIRFVHNELLDGPLTKKL